MKTNTAETPVPNLHRDVDGFTRAYIVSALWSSNDGDGEPLDRAHSWADIAPDTLARMIGDCRKFQLEHGGTIQAAIATGEVVCGPDFGPMGRAGHDFRLTRNHHGCGFRDGDRPQPQAKQLTDAAHAFGQCELYVGDDDRIYS